MGAKWQLQEAKNRFSELVERAMNEGPQTVTRHGKDAVVIISAAAFSESAIAAKAKRQNLAEFLLQSPLAGSGLRVKRRRDTGRLLRLDE